MSSRINLKILIGILLIFLTLSATAYVLSLKHYQWLFLTLPILFILLSYIFRMQRKAYSELNDFVESVRYKDFSRRFNIKKAPLELRKLRSGFNEINDAFRNISREKETQYQYLQKIMEMVNTGILSYDIETREVHWINESLKKLLQVPYLKSVTSLEKRDTQLYHDLISLKPGESKISSVHSGLETTKILLSATAFQTENRKYALIGFHNISSAMDETESEAWKKLLSVMTHEIMNSVAPISSLADTLHNRLKENRDKYEEDNEFPFSDIDLGIDTIKKRSESLLKFAETYRSLNKVATPTLSTFYVRDLFENIFILMEPTLRKKNIEMEVMLRDPELKLTADISLIEQSLINLVVNAMEAVKDKEEKRIVLVGETAENKTLIRITDNGKGMSPEILDKIFIPFFTTRKNGSGIGLSLCRQIMRAHQGNLHVASEEGKGTVFTLQFNN